MQMRWVVMVGLMVLASARLAAHDFWLAATPWDPGAQVTISANLGEIFPVATDRVVAEGVERWRVLGPGGEMHLDAALRNDGRALTADVQLPAPGAYLATMTIRPNLTRMQAPSFNSYLVEEGLDWVVAARREAGVSERPATERFTRYAKVAVRNGFGTGVHLTRAVGLPAEFVPMTDPTIVRPGQLLTFQLLADGRPVAGAVVTGRSSQGGHPVMGRTDETGHVTLPIDRPGAWLVRTVHMRTGAQASVPDVEWDSYWATFAFHTARN
jgi:uncharacterized GH25 family protein